MQRAGSRANGGRPTGSFGEERSNKTGQTHPCGSLAVGSSGVSACDTWRVRGGRRGGDKEAWRRLEPARWRAYSKHAGCPAKGRAWGCMCRGCTTARVCRAYVRARITRLVGRRGQPPSTRGRRCHLEMRTHACQGDSMTVGRAAGCGAARESKQTHLGPRQGAGGFEQLVTVPATVRERVPLSARFHGRSPGAGLPERSGALP